MESPLKIDISNMDGAVILKPYLSQVGGHNVFLKYDATTLCKPFHPHEYHFYKKLSPSLKSFIPEFRGLARVKRMVSPHSTDEVYYIAIPIDDSSLNSSDYLRTSLEERNQSIEKLEESNMTQAEVDSAVKVIEQTLYDENAGTLESKFSHPWIVDARRKFDIKWVKYNYDTKVFMLLENITANFEYPSILDLKIGFRAHGDITHEAKRKRKEERINSSTSSVCGIRLCGMQTFDPIDKNFSFVDKYHGRKINLEELKTKLYEFFKIDDSYHIYFIVIFIIKIKRLINSLRTHDSLRLFATSLLVVFQNQQYDFEPISHDNYFLKFPPLLQSELKNKNFHLAKSDASSVTEHASLATLFDDKIERVDNQRQIASWRQNSSSKLLTTESERDVADKICTGRSNLAKKYVSSNSLFSKKGQLDCVNHKNPNIRSDTHSDSNMKGMQDCDKNSDGSGKDSSEPIACLTNHVSTLDIKENHRLDANTDYTSNHTSTAVDGHLEQKTAHTQDSISSIQNNNGGDRSEKFSVLESETHVFENNKSCDTSREGGQFLQTANENKDPSTIDNSIECKYVRSKCLNGCERTNIIKDSNEKLEMLDSFDKSRVMCEMTKHKMDINKMLNDPNFFAKYEKYVDVRLIDFAQASFIGTSDKIFIDYTIKNLSSGIRKFSNSEENINQPKVTSNFNHLCHMGPDCEFLTGLENICIFFESLLFDLFINSSSGSKHCDSST